MMTVEHRNDSRTQREIRLKFWKNKRDTQAESVFFIWCTFAFHDATFQRAL